MASLISSIVAGFVAFRPRISGITVEFNVARVPIPKISSEARGALGKLTADGGAPDWPNLFFALSFLQCVDLVSIGLRNTMDRPTGDIEVWAPGVRLWHFHDYQKPPLDSKLPIGTIEPHGAITITSIIDAGGSQLDMRVFEDGHQVATL